jgi:hypothetical protein
MNEVERITAKNYPWPPIKSYNPDENPSSGAIYIEALGPRVVGVLQVRGLGVLVFTAQPPAWHDASGKLKFDGTLAIFDKTDIGFAPNI